MTTISTADAKKIICLLTDLRSFATTDTRSVNRKRYADLMIKKLTKKTQMIHEESKLQIACVRWFRMQYRYCSDLLFAVPNGGARGAVEACILKSEGVTAGVSDLILLIGRGGYSSLCIEMKTPSKASRQSPAQKMWQKTAEIYGNKYVVCRTLEDFMREVTAYFQPV